MKRLLPLYVLPAVLMLLWALWPLVSGQETLYLRDVLNTHLGMKLNDAEALAAGELRSVDLYRGGQPSLGNLNGVPLYPDNLLYLFAPLFWALNAHFWIHLLLAPPAMAWLARAWGLGRRASWGAGVCYALSGYYVAHLNFYNLIAGVTLAPALVAAALESARRPDRRRYPIAFALLWALLLLAGDPLIAAQAGLLAATAIFVRGSVPTGALVRLAAAAVAGTLVALPQLVEFLRILPASYRGRQGFSAASGTIASWDLRQLVEWLLPFAFGRPDRVGLGAFWGERFHTGAPAYYFTLYPGLLTLGLVAALGRPRERRALWAWGIAAAGLFVALGRFNPVMSLAFELPVGRFLRYPVKFWLPVAVGGALLAGLGLERLVSSGDPDYRRRLQRLLTAGLWAFVLAWATFSLLRGPSETLLAGLMPSEAPRVAVVNERLRWAGLCLFSILALGLLRTAFALARRTRLELPALLLGVHVVAQLFFLRPAMVSDDLAVYTARSPLADHVSADELLVHGAFGRLFGHTALGTGAYPDGRSLWLERHAFAELYPFAGAVLGLRYELVGSPEGLDTFLSEVASQVIERAADVDRLRLLEAWGVDVLLLDRQLEPDARWETAGLARERHRAAVFDRPVWVYELPGAAPEVAFVGQVDYAPHVNAAVERLWSADFDARRMTVLPGEGPPLIGAGGRVLEVLADGEDLTVRLAAEEAGALVVQRNHLPIYRATVDGEEVPVREANVYRIGIEVPAGEHEVRLFVDRAPFRRALLGSLAGLLLIGGLSLPHGAARRRAESGSI